MGAALGFGALSGYEFISLMKDTTVMMTTLSANCDFNSINGTLL